jgi:hypothetical protein
MLGLIPKEALPKHHAILIAHLDREVCARIDGVRFTVGVRDLVHVDPVEGDLDADAAAALWIVDEDELAAFAVWEMAEEVFVGGALFVEVGG